jgi:DNA (cytosine-5)-methyltransferase 1
MRYLSVCSGIEAATVAWDPLGWDAAGFSEIDKFPSAVLAHHYPEVPNFGDFTTIKADDVGAIDILVGGTPCQSFSVAGLRGGLADDRGNLALEFLRLAQRARPRWLVWENVPGVLSSAGGRDFGAILGGMVECGYGFAYRVLDAQYFGLAQRRKRVFVVGYLGDWRRAAAVLFERQSLSWNPPPRSQAWKEVAGTLGSRTTAGGGLGTDFDLDGGLQVAGTLGQRTCDHTSGIKSESDFLVIPLTVATLDANYGKLQGCSGQDSGHGHSHLIPIQSVQAVREKRQNGIGIGQDGDSMFTLTGRDRRAVAFRTTGNDGAYELGDLAGCLNTGTDQSAQVVAFHENQRGELTVNDTAGSLKVGGGKPGQGYPAVETGSAVRRLTPRECERLQGFPDDYTAIPYRGKLAADGPRYRALGNSMAVPVMAWIGKQIQSVEALSRRAS